MKRIYISGPMTGIPESNFPAFHAEAERLRTLGYDVVNPAEIDHPDGSKYNDWLRADLVQLLTCDTIAVLDGWLNSNGAQLEVQLAHRIGMPIFVSREIVVPSIKVMPTHHTHHEVIA